MTEKVLDIIAAVMGVPRAGLSIDASPATIGQWDSLKHITLILAAEEQFGVQFTDREIAGIEDARSLVSALESKGAR
jgi:acyl carrier protein